MDYPLLYQNFLTQYPQLTGPRQRLLHECLRSAIRKGTLHAGLRLLGTRQLASELGLARNTVLYAYEQLATEGYVSSDRQGTVVVDLKLSVQLRVTSGESDAAQDVLPLAQARLSRRAQNQSHTHNQAQLQVQSQEGAALDSGASKNTVDAVLPDAALTSAFAPGVPALADFPQASWRRLLDRAWRSCSVAQLNYGEAAGELRLRVAIADHLRASRGVLCEADQVFITDGTQSSLDLCARLFADAGDTVWMENPGYKGALTAFHAAQLQVHAVSLDEQGLAPDEIDIVQHRPKLIYVTPSHQYPLGSVLSLSRRMQLIAHARAASALIIEDDYDSEFRHDGPPLAAMQGLVPDAPVLYLGTFSKTMFPALRIGFMLVPKHLVAALTLALAHAVPRGRACDQLALAEFIQSGQFAAHLRKMRRVYRHRRDVLAAALGLHLGDLGVVCGGSAGMHLALILDARAPDTLVCAQALQQGIVVHPLSLHALSHQAPVFNGLVLGYAQIAPEQIEIAVEKLAHIVRQLVR
ncbi:PLP-dependent aminotransferase family protein [Undibacterium sp.]|uniref:MocR-like pyridoxine biosynthesis transcription factor PdxR n=1 Tax=Undibacterium sp. TaxID=1914977 RepID=UPI0025DB8EC9|nr:PLP-dependent aminotransferase family protein [Undibacterium sp.]